VGNFGICSWLQSPAMALDGQSRTSNISMGKRRTITISLQVGFGKAERFATQHRTEPPSMKRADRQAGRIKLNSMSRLETSVERGCEALPPSGEPVGPFCRKGLSPQGEPPWSAHPLPVVAEGGSTSVRVFSSRQLPNGRFDRRRPERTEKRRTTRSFYQYEPVWPIMEGVSEGSLRRNHAGGRGPSEQRSGEPHDVNNSG